MNNQQKWILSLIAGLLFTLVSLPITYGITNQISNVLANYDLFIAGGPSMIGMLIHAVVFSLLFRLVLQFYPSKA